MVIKLVSFAAMLLFGFGAARGNADDFAARCALLPAQVKISTTFQDRQVLTNNTNDIQALTRRSGKAADDNRKVYGLTHAVPTFQLQVTPQAVVEGDGRICAMPNLAVELGFSEFVVYLARELTDPCQQDIIRQHEQEHVGTWKSNMRASAQLLTTVLRRDVGEPRFYATREEAEADIRQWANELVAPWAKRLFSSILDAQASIDTPTSYSLVTRRLRTCPRTMPRGGG